MQRSSSADLTARARSTGACASATSKPSAASASAAPGVDALDADARPGAAVRAHELCDLGRPRQLGVGDGGAGGDVARGDRRADLVDRLQPLGEVHAAGELVQDDGAVERQEEVAHRVAQVEDLHVARAGRVADVDRVDEDAGVEPRAPPSARARAAAGGREARRSRWPPAARGRRAARGPPGRPAPRASRRSSAGVWQAVAWRGVVRSSPRPTCAGAVAALPRPPDRRRRAERAGLAQAATARRRRRRSRCGGRRRSRRRRAPARRAGSARSGRPPSPRRAAVPPGRGSGRRRRSRPGRARRG